MTKDEALTLALEALTYCEALNKDVEQQKMQAITAIKEALAQPDYRAVKTYHEGKPVYVSQTEFPPECKTVAEQTAYAFGWWKALESVRTEQPAQEPEELRHIGKRDCLFDVDELAWRSIVKNRGGCQCHISPPCNACVEPIEEEELNDVGYTYTTPQPRPWVGLTDEERNDIYNQCQGVKVGSAISLTEAKLKEKNT